MDLASLKNAEGAKKAKFRKGQGRGTGNGKTCGKGNKGQGAHNHTKKNGFEGGQLPYARRIPKFGFKNINRKEFAVVKLERLNVFKDGDKVSLTDLIEKGLVKKTLAGVKILAGGKLERKLDLTVNAISASAKAEVEALGGSITTID